MARTLGVAWASLAFCALLPSASGAKTVNAENALELTDESWDDHMREHDRVLVYFWAAWCEACAETIPYFNEAARLLAEDGLKSKIALASNEAAAAAAKKHNVETYPMVLYFENGEFNESYMGQSGNPMDIKMWLEAKESPFVQEWDADMAAKYEQQATNFERSSMLPSVLPRSEYGIVAKVVQNSVRHRQFNKTVSAAIAADPRSPLRARVIFLPRPADPKGPEVTLSCWRPHFRPLNKRVVSFNGKWLDLEIQRFLAGCSLEPIARKFDTSVHVRENVELHGKLGSVLLATDQAAEADAVDAMIADLTPFAESERRFFFATSPRGDLCAEGRRGTGVLPNASGSVAVVLHAGSKYHREVVPGANVTGVVEGLIADVLAGKAQARRTSAPVPADGAKAGGVVTVVSDSWEDIVGDSTKDVLVWFDGDDCEQCNLTRSVLEELAATVIFNGWDQQGIVLAKIDLRENEVPDKHVLGPNDIALYPAVASDKKLKLRKAYRSGVSVRAFVAFLEDYARNPITEAESAGPSGNSKRARARGEL